MKKLRIKSLLPLLLAIIFSCDKKHELETAFETKKNEYWKYIDACGGGRGLFFKFNKDGSYDKYNRFIDDGFELFNNDGDLISGKRTWSIKNDSIFVWDNEEYKIEKYSTQQIRLSYYHYKKKNKKCSITLNKVKW